MLTAMLASYRFVTNPFMRASWWKAVSVQGGHIQSMRRRLQLAIGQSAIRDWIKSTWASEHTMHGTTLPQLRCA